MRLARSKMRVRPSYPSRAAQWAGPMIVAVFLTLLDVLAANGYESRMSGLLVFLLVIFVSCWSGLWSGLLASLVVLAYIPIAASIPQSANYQISNIERRMIGAAIVFPLTAIVAGVVQNKLRSAATRTYDAQEAASKEAEQRHRAETELQHSEQLRGIVVDSAMDAVVAINADGLVTLWNPGATKLFGWSSEEMIGRRLSETIIPAKYCDDHERGLARFRETGEGAIFGKRLELTALDKGGREFEVELSVVPHVSPVGTVIVAFIRDISMQKRMQQELQIAHRLDSVGQLAGGIAHDFNNVLSVIVGYSELAKRQLPGDHAIQHDLNQILAAARRCFDINTHLLSFARKQVMAPRNVSLNEIVSGVGPMFKTLLRENIELTLNLAEDLWPVLVDPGQVEQLLTNLAINARDAMPHGGRLLIETRNISIEADEDLPVPNFEPGEYATVSVTDTGMGIPRQHLDRIFEPFFTTKEGRGSGLGLASAYGIVKQAGGRISVYSEPGHGTMFRVYIPRTMGAVEHLADKTIKAPAERGTETVLVAEDNDQVRAVIEQTLRYFGYAVITADSGESALARAREYGPGIDLLVTDLIMPRGGGSELAQRLRAERPDLRVIFLSGYTEETVSAEGVEGIGGAFLQKPVMPSDLAAKVREVLDAQSPANL